MFRTQKVKSSARRLLRDRGGNFAMMTAVTAVPLVGAAALGIDYTMMTKKRAELQQSLDADAAPADAE